ncbi:hypothetical protein CEXT_244991 [Caerostris extrusa]|uniref:Uncharacterized protein n=1 Tax=Caerostris extrusa TaxID=172846 RepID=A0AAV4V330_CAEEX|nr:hypothetical protein CEXT_244991 [Caerostris extrusa]
MIADSCHLFGGLFGDECETGTHNVPENKDNTNNTRAEIIRFDDRARKLQISTGSTQVMTFTAVIVACESPLHPPFADPRVEKMAKKKWRYKTSLLTSGDEWWQQCDPGL